MADTNRTEAFPNDYGSYAAGTYGTSPSTSEYAGYTDPGFTNEPTQQFAAPAATGSMSATEPTVVAEKRGTTGLGLLILRVAVGAIMVVHGLQKLAGWWGGPGLSGFEDVLIAAGYEQTGILATAGAIGEVAAGALLILGLATPFAAASVVAVMINAWCFKQVSEPGLQFFAPAGVEYETLIGVAAAAIALTGPGRIAIDGGRKWAKRPFVGSTLILVLGIAAGVAIWVVLNGANPIA